MYQYLIFMYSYYLTETTLAINFFKLFFLGRWDIQRIREQRMLQRLQQRMEKKKPNVQESEPDLSSFYPDVDNGITLRFRPCPH